MDWKLCLFYLFVVFHFPFYFLFFLMRFHVLTYWLFFLALPLEISLPIAKGIFFSNPFRFGCLWRKDKNKKVKTY